MLYHHALAVRAASELPCDLYDALRPAALERLMALRGESAAPGAVARALLEALLCHMGDFLRTADERPYREFLARWMAVVVGEGAPPTSLFSSVRTTCEVVVELCERGEPSADEVKQLALSVARLQLATGRLLVDILAKEGERVWRLCEDSREP